MCAFGVNVDCCKPGAVDNAQHVRGALDVELLGLVLSQVKLT